MAGLVSDRAVLYVFKIEGGRAWYLLLRCAPDSVHAGAWETVLAEPRDGEGSARAAIRSLVEMTSLDPVSLWGLEHVETEYDAEVDAIRLMPCFVALVSGDVKLGNSHDASRWFSATEAGNAVRSGPKRESIEAMHHEIGQIVAAGAEPEARLRLV
ncbi:MAG: NUDIX domain-containing protein [Planctomycetes bacterium]|nr:NUDIX domain-containing protein [Planctomycetota bacterium]